MKKYLFLVATAVITPLFTLAQTAEWLVAPQYSEMAYFANHMYKVKQNGKVGVVSADGEVLVKPEYDAINLFYEGRTMFVNRTSGGWQLMGVLTDDGTVSYPRDTYYLLPDYMFYSEGFLPVRNASGQYGYLDTNCDEAFPFVDDEVKPFSEGLAVVGSGDSFRWVTTSGERVDMRLKDGYAYDGTNYYNGEVIVSDEVEHLYQVGGDGKLRKVKFNISGDDLDYLYRYGSTSGSEIPYTKYTPTYSYAWTPEQRDGLWSYMSSQGKLLAPFQYDKVEPFIDGVAIAKTEGKYGLLHVVPDNSTFSTSTKQNKHIFSAGGVCSCEFSLSVPEKWKGQPISVLLKDPDTGSQLEIEKTGRNKYSFDYKPDASSPSEDKAFRVEVKNNGIKLWQGEECFHFVQRTKLKSSIVINNADANSYDQCLVTATIKNPSPIAVTTTITLEGGGEKAQFNRKTVTLTIPAYGSKSIQSSFLVKKVELNGWCRVSADGTSAQRTNLELKPF